MNKYTPDRWIVLEMTAETGEKCRKVFAGWYGGFAGSDNWKLSSGNKEVIEYDDRFEFPQDSGSLYICYKHSYGMTGYMASVYSMWSKQLETSGSKGSMEIIEEFDKR